jgi:ribose 5-phosphate isomerase B
VNAREAPVLIAIGSDEVGLELKDAIQAHLRRLPGCPVRCIDVNPTGDPEVDVPEIAQTVAESILRGVADRGILVCGSGVGMVIAANKVPGIRAAQCHDVYTAEHARNSDDAQVIVLGSRVIGTEQAKRVVEAWLRAEFEPNERRRRRMAKLDAIERSYLRSASGPSSPAR